MTSTIGDYFDATQQLDDYCAANESIWEFDDHGVPYIEDIGIDTAPMYGARARRQKELEREIAEDLNAHIEEQILPLNEYSVVSEEQLRREMLLSPLNRIAELVNQKAEITPVSTTLEDVTGIIGYLIKDAPCQHDFIVLRDTKHWYHGFAYCDHADCGSGYGLVFGDDGELIGVEPWGK
jgi:hypothetical protein